MAKRYQPGVYQVLAGQYECEMTDDDAGDYVLHSDYRALRTRLAEVEAQRDMLKNVIIFIKDECDWEPTMHEGGGDERIGNVITEALAKLEVK